MNILLDKFEKMFNQYIMFVMKNVGWHSEVKISKNIKRIYL